MEAVKRCYRLSLLCLTMCVGATHAAEPDAHTPAHSAEITSCVSNAYHQILGRRPDSEGLAVHCEALLSGEGDIDWLYRTLRESPEARTRTARLRAARRSRVVLVLLWMALFAGISAIGQCMTGCLCSKRDPQHTLSLFQSFWLGLGSVTALLQLSSLLLPINKTYLLCLTAVALACLAHACTDVIRRGWRPTLRGTVPFTLSSLILSWLAATLITSTRGVPYDTLLYHWTAVSWANTFPVVPGLANLHIRLGTNTASLLFAALLDNGSLNGHSAWIVPGFIPIIFTLYLGATVLSKKLLLRVRLLALLLLPYCLKEMAAVAPSLYYDTSTLMLLMAGTIELMKLLGTRPLRTWRRKPPTPTELLPTATLAALSFVWKPIGAVILGAVLAALAWAAWAIVSKGRPRFRQLCALILPAALLAGWMLRNALLSGWLLFPSATGKLPVDWAVPESSTTQCHASQIQTVRGQGEIIQAWSRSPGPEYMRALDAPLREWVPAWYRANRNTFELRWALPAALFFAVASLLLRACVNRQELLSEVLLALLIMAQVLFWFLHAPNLRFGAPLLWLGAAVAVSGPLTATHRRPPATITGWGIAICLGVVLAAHPSQDIVARLRSAAHSLPGVGASYPCETRPVSLANGQSPALIVYVPTKGDQAGDAPLPNTPYPRDTLLARRPDSLRHGFWVVPEE